MELLGYTIPEYVITLTVGVIIFLGLISLGKWKDKRNQKKLEKEKEQQEGENDYTKMSPTELYEYYQKLTIEMNIVKKRYNEMMEQVK